MALVPGTRLGAYEVLSALGAGGLGEVYRARDEDAVTVRVLIMELVEGPTLCGSMAFDKALAIAREIAEARAVTHDRNSCDDDARHDSRDCGVHGS